MSDPAVHLRPAVASDSRCIWEWRNEPSVRAVSFSDRIIPLEEHEQWFASRIHDPATELLVVADAGDSVSRDIGFVRFDLRGPAAEINVCLTPDARGRGLGRAVIRQSSEQLLRGRRAERIVALVRPGNERSLAAFSAAGFVTIGRTERPGVDAWELHFTMPVVLFRVDADADIGIGHLQRCLALAAALADEGCSVSFLVNDSAIVRDRVAAAGWPAVTLRGAASWSDLDADRLIEEAAAQRASIVVVDSDREPASYMRRVKASGVLLCAVEDNGNAEVVADVLLNGDVHAGLQPYAGETADTQFLLGPAFAPLARDYWATGSAAAVPPKALLLTLGGSDRHGVMPALLAAVSRLPETLSLHVVIGPFTGRDGEISAALAPLAGRVTVHRQPASMAPIIAACDVALSAAGQTLYELAARGRPAVAIEVADNQRLQLEMFVRSGAVVRAGAASDPGIADRAVALVAQLAGEHDALRAMAASGRALIDGQGARRAAAALIARRAPSSVER